MATEPTAGQAPMTCPDCAGPVWPQRDRLCPKCGYPLMFLQQESEPEPEVVARAPGEQGDATTVTPPGPGPGDRAPTTGAQPGQTTCPRCGHHNPPDRVRCERCGQELSTTRSAAPLPPAPPAPPSPPRRFGWVAWLVAALLATALAVGTIVVVVALVNRGDDRDDQAGPTGGPTGGPAPTETPEPTPVPVDSASVTATATSTLPAGDRFAVANTLDDDRTTCWQSAGDQLESNEGVQLTYQFSHPIRLARVTLVNGWARSPEDYENNQRVARATVQTDAGARTWRLRDTAEPQTIELNPVATSLVTLVVEEVYEGERFRDLAITEVSFEQLP